MTHSSSTPLIRRQKDDGGEERPAVAVDGVVVDDADDVTMRATSVEVATSHGDVAGVLPRLKRWGSCPLTGGEGVRPVTTEMGLSPLVTLRDEWRPRPRVYPEA